MSARRKRKAPATADAGAGAAAASAAASTSAPTGFAGIQEEPKKILLRLRGRRRGAVRVQLPTVRAPDEQPSSNDGSGAARWRQDRKLASPRDGVVLNISLFDGDFDLHIDGGKGGGGGGGGGSAAEAAAAAPTADLLVPWDPAKASENHVVFETYNAHVHLHSLFTAYQAKVPAPIVTVRCLVFDPPPQNCRQRKPPPQATAFACAAPLLARGTDYPLPVSARCVGPYVLEYGCCPRGPIRFVQANQIYSVVGDRTVGDREIRELADRGVFRILRSPAQ